MSNNELLGMGKWGYWGQINCWIKRDDLPSDGEFINFTVKPMKKVSEKGYSHSVVVNNFKPGEKKTDNRSSYERKSNDNKPLDDTSDLPF